MAGPNRTSAPPQTATAAAPEAAEEQASDTQSYDAAFPTDGIILGGEQVALYKKPDLGDTELEITTHIPPGERVTVAYRKQDWIRLLWETNWGWVPAGQVEVLSPRFSRQTEFVDCLLGSSIGLGESGPAVSVLQQTLHELGHLPISAITGTFGDGTEQAVKGFQIAQGIRSQGHLEAETMLALNRIFLGYQHEAALLKRHVPLEAPKAGLRHAPDKVPAELMIGTRNISFEEQMAFEAMISTESQGESGADPVFQETVEGELYGDRMRAALDRIIPAMYQRIAAGKAELRSNPENLHNWGDIENVCLEAKKATDAHFGKYVIGNPLKTSGVDAQILDAWESKEKELAEDPSAVEEEWLVYRMERLLDGHPTFKAIDQAHGALPSRTEEAAILDPIKAEMMAKYRMELIETHKAWSGFVDDDGRIHIQRFKSRNKEGEIDMRRGRNYMWDLFQTVIHEYLHVLEHDDHWDYRKQMDDSEGALTLQEGVTDYFTKIVYNNTDKSAPDLRRKVEGPFHEPEADYSPPLLIAYGESRNAEAAAGLIGFANMAAAFFLGRTDLYKHQ